VGTSGDDTKLCINEDGSETGCRQMRIRVKSVGTGGNGDGNNSCQCASLYLKWITIQNWPHEQHAYTHKLKYKREVKHKEMN